MIKILKIIVRNLIYLTHGHELNLWNKIKLKISPGYTTGTVTLLGTKIQYTDAPSFVSMFEEIFIRHIYQFDTGHATPTILDCGANIGLAIIYLKLHYPHAKIIAFEPDGNIFKVLQSNIAAYGFHGVELQQAAVWRHNGFIEFVLQGGLSGQVVDQEGERAGITKVPCVRLQDYLHQPVDFLKIDIEGAEYEVLLDCKDHLKNARLIFLEYHSTFGKPQHLDELLRILSNSGFRYYMQEAFTSPAPFKEVKTMVGMDLQMNIFAIK